MLFREENWAELIKQWREGKRCEIDEGVFDYFLEALPPVCMNRLLTVKSGARIHAAFGYAEGSELITAFWRMGDESDGGPRYFLEQTDIVNRA
jgi:hypothetical protein